MRRKIPGRFIVSLVLPVAMFALTSGRAFVAAAGGKPEKTDVVVTYAQPSGAFTLSIGVIP